MKKERKGLTVASLTILHARSFILHLVRDKAIVRLPNIRVLLLVVLATHRVESDLVRQVLHQIVALGGVDVARCVQNLGDAHERVGRIEEALGGLWEGKRVRLASRGFLGYVTMICNWVPQKKSGCNKCSGKRAILGGKVYGNLSKHTWRSREKGRHD